MATYKLIQDIEAEDHILGPLTLRQFIYAIVAAFCLYMCFVGLTKNIWPLWAIFLPPALFAGFFAFPFGKDQPTEVWALAKIRFLFKPRRRIWNQSGVKELVTITAPKKIEHNYTDGLSQNEVKSRLKALANTLDSRGWAIKNVGLAAYARPPRVVASDSDRLIDISSMPQQVPDYDMLASDDMLDERANPVAQQFSQMMNTSAQTHRQQIIDQLNTGQPASPSSSGGWFLGQNMTDQTGVDMTPEEQKVVAKAKRREQDDATAKSHLRTVQPLGKDHVPKAKKQGSATSTSTSGKNPDPAILELANNNDLDVATLARQAQKAKDSDGMSDGEVISLH